MSRQLKDSLLKENQTVLDAYKYWDAHNKLDCTRDTIIKIFFSSMAATIAGISVVPFGKSTYEGSELIPLCNYSVSHDFCQANAEAGSYFLNWSLNTLYFLYDELNKNKGLNESIVNEYINESIILFEKKTILF